MADIDRMRAALVAARECIQYDRDSWVGCTHPAVVAQVEKYDALLAQIDAALAQEAQR